MKIYSKQKTYTKIIALAAIVLLIGILSYLTYAKSASVWPFATSVSPQDIESEDTINYSPPTEQEIEDSQNAKKRGDAENQTKESTDTSQSSKSTVPVAISSAEIINDNLEVRAFTPRVIEGSGTCTATVSSGSKSVTAKSAAFVDVSSSICEPIFISVSKLSSSMWQVVVDYSSPNAQGISQPVMVTIP